MEAAIESRASPCRASAPRTGSRSRRCSTGPSPSSCPRAPPSRPPEPRPSKRRATSTTREAPRRAPSSRPGPRSASTEEESMRSRPATALCILLLPAATAGAGEARIFLNGLYNVSSLKYSDSRTFTEFTEQATLDTEYEAKSAFGFEGGLQFNFIKHLGLAASFATVSRDASGSYTASLPHPLYLNRPREVSGEATSLEYKE